jgi:hypothetical protein
MLEHMKAQSWLRERIISRAFALALLTLLLLLPATEGRAGLFDDLMRGLGMSGEPLTEETIDSGLREALTVATEKAVRQVSRRDGYFGNLDIRILFPERIRKVADMLSAVGYDEQVEAFVLSMNRAAERAAPEAASIFVDAIGRMSIMDARRILDGGDTAATDYFRKTTSGRLAEAFRPLVSESMDAVGVTRWYKELIERYNAIPFMETEGLDLDDYVTGEAMKGLFFMLAEEERRIRTDPAARVTELLRQVFGE